MANRGPPGHGPAMARCRLLLGIAAATLVACEPDPTALTPKNRDGGIATPDADRSPDDAGPVDSGASLDAGPLDQGAPDLGPPDLGSPDAGSVEPRQVVRFIALGDTGEGNRAQYEVSEVIEMVCMVQGCDFALLLGDNFYDSGVHSVDDEQFRTKFEEPYANLQLQFWVTLGNHDFGLLPVEFWRTDYQIEYSARSSKWNMPDHFYTFAREHVTFVSLDTNMIMLGLDWVRDQKDWFEEQVARANTPWIVAYGHHPFRSNGPHGNAGNYEGLGRLDPTGIVNGERIEAFFRDELCGRVDLLLAGHDHSRQWLEPECDMELIVSGAGAKLTELERRDGNRVRFEDDTLEGFFWIEIADDVMTVEAWNRNGQMDFRDTVPRPN